MGKKLFKKTIFISRLEKIANKLTQNQIINSMMFLYIISLYFFSNREGFNFISNIIALILIGLLWTNFYLEKRKFVFNRFLLIHLLFIFVCFISIFFTINHSVSIIKVRTLVLLFILMITLVNYIDTQDKLIKVMKYFAISGFLVSLYILISSPFLQINRYGKQLGNVNAIGMIVGISSVFCFYFILEQKKYIFIPIVLTNLVVILLTGSRTSLIFFVIALIIILISKRRAGKGIEIKFLLASAIIIFVGFYIINHVPIFYQTIGIRMENLLSFVLGEGTIDRSINLRYYMTQTGFGWFKARPFTGYGIDNFRLLFAGVPDGSKTYSHNNIIELLVGVGLFGTFLYYFAIITVIEGLIEASHVLSKTLCYSFIAIIIGYLFMSVGLVYYYSKNFCIILAVGSTVYRLAKNEKKDKKIITEK